MIKAEPKQFLYKLIEVPESKVKKFENFCKDNNIWFKFSHIILLHDGGGNGKNGK